MLCYREFSTDHSLFAWGHLSSYHLVSLASLGRTWLTCSQYDLDVQEDQLKSGKKPGDSGYGIEDEQKFGILTSINGGIPLSKPHPTNNTLNYQHFYMDLAQALDGKGSVPVDPRSSAAVIRLIELARQSSQEGKTLTVDLLSRHGVIHDYVK